MLIKTNVKGPIKSRCGFPFFNNLRKMINMIDNFRDWACMIIFSCPGLRFVELSRRARVLSWRILLAWISCPGGRGWSPVVPSNSDSSTAKTVKLITRTIKNLSGSSRMTRQKKNTSTSTKSGQK